MAHIIYITIQKGGNGGIPFKKEKDWAKAKLKPNKANIKAWSSMFSIWGLQFQRI